MKNLVFIGLVCSLAALCPSLSLHAVDLGQVDIHGFVSQGYLKSSANNYLSVETEKGSYEYNEVGVNLSTSLTEKLRVGVQLLSRDFGDVGNNEFNLDWAMADFKWRDELGFRFGKVKRPIGLYNEGRDVDMLRTFVFLPQGIYSEALREYQNSSEGFGIYGTLTAGALGTFDYQSVLGAPSLTARDTKEAQLLTIAIPVMDIDDVDIKARYASDSQLIWNTPLKGLRLGGTLTYSKAELTGPLPDPMPELVVNLDERGSYVLSGEYQSGGLTLAAEYLQLNMKLDVGLPGETFDKMDSVSYYGSISYRFTEWLEAGGYYSVYYLMKRDKEGDLVQAYGFPDYAAWQKEGVATLRFDLNPNWILKLEGHRINGVGQEFASSQADDLKENWWLFAAKTTVSF
jgi:hypothetical protein